MGIVADGLARVMRDLPESVSPGEAPRLVGELATTEQIRAPQTLQETATGESTASLAIVASERSTRLPIAALGVFVAASSAFAIWRATTSVRDGAAPGPASQSAPAASIDLPVVAAPTTSAPGPVPPSEAVSAAVSVDAGHRASAAPAGRCECHDPEDVLLCQQEKIRSAVSCTCFDPSTTRVLCAKKLPGNTCVNAPADYAGRAIGSQCTGYRQRADKGDLELVEGYISSCHDTCSDFQTYGGPAGSSCVGSGWSGIKTSGRVVCPPPRTE
jgi:hypothetical protein